ncbi:hypothetical protein [Mesorhizobium sp. CO1-1-9]|uniref:hypothetical protein n=1 Tax=Mesorhizobium sp. CO1-1-9 TaxID=2876630 RepID=UPI001CCBF662|nr:hypothetical protein [Mesorhizobium sp. CO1-1-9]MBZ9698819.1 hypothetical protein [Mesorhizobium sp. CO1-1-9]
MIEKAIQDRNNTRTRVTFAGKTSTKTNFDPRKFALLLIEKRGKSKSISMEERTRRQAEMEAKVAAD